MRKYILTFLIIIFVLHVNAYAHDPVEPDTIRVGVHVSPPYVIEHGDGRYSGIAVDLLKRILVDSAVDKPVVFTKYTSVKDLLGAMDEIDIAVSNLTYTPERSKAFDLSIPYDEGGLGVLITSDLNDRKITQFPVATYVYIASGIFIASLILTIIDRKYNPRFTRNWIHGFSESLFHIVSILLKGSSRRESFFSKTVQYWFSVFWMVCGSALVSFLMVTYMGFFSGSDSIKSVSEFAGHTVAVQEGSSAENYVRDSSFDYITFKTIDDGINMILNKKAIAIIGDKTVLNYYAHTNKGRKLHVLDDIYINSELYGYILPEGSELRRKITEGVIFNINNGKVKSIKTHYGAD